MRLIDADALIDEIEGIEPDGCTEGGKNLYSMDTIKELTEGILMSCEKKRSKKARQVELLQNVYNIPAWEAEKLYEVFNNKSSIR